jgi:tRNA U34 5-methylaminomethyl-2-thiouridine-forming methyltransferase MnmC
MKREILITADGSTTIRIPDWDENYHSSHGAIQEAKHVFIANGLDLFKNQAEISILEIGFGTGLRNSKQRKSKLCWSRSLSNCSRRS